MLKTKQALKQGFTIIELLIVIAIIAILALLVLNNFQGAQAKARDTQRRTDMNNLHGKLEEYYNEKGGYPNENINATSLPLLLPGTDEGSIKDAKDGYLKNSFSTGATAPASTVALTAGNEYEYAGYNCANAASTPAVVCGKYVLRAALEKPSASEVTAGSAFVKNSLN